MSKSCLYINNKNNIPVQRMLIVFWVWLLYYTNTKYAHYITDTDTYTHV